MATKQKEGLVFDQHPAIQFPSELKLIGFEDESWGNDAAARATLHLNGAPDVGPDSASWPLITCWCAEENPKDRECGDKMPRYVAHAVRNQKEHDEEGGRFLYAGEDIHTLVLCIKAYIAQWQASVGQLIEDGKI